MIFKKKVDFYCNLTAVFATHVKFDALPHLKSQFVTIQVLGTITLHTTKVQQQTLKLSKTPHSLKNAQ